MRNGESSSKSIKDFSIGRIVMDRVAIESMASEDIAIVCSSDAIANL